MRIYVKLSCAGVAIFVTVGHGAVHGLFVIVYYLVSFVGFPWLTTYLLEELDCGQDWLEIFLVVTLIALFFVPLAALYFSWWIYLASAVLMVSILCLAYIIAHFHWKTFPFHKAVNLGKSKVVGRLLRGGQDVNAPDREGLTPLIYAVKGRHVQVVRQLLEAGADPNGSGNRPLHLACNHVIGKPDVNIVRLLLENGADANGMCEHGSSPLHALCENAGLPSDVAIVRLLLHHGADVDARDKRGFTPLMKVICSYGINKKVLGQIVDVFLARGADIEAESMVGLTAIKLARRENKPSVVEKLRAIGG